MRRQIPMLLAALSLSFLSSCTLIRYVDPPPEPGEEPDPKVVDVLILTELPRGSANLMAGYATFLELFEYGLGEYNIATRQVAIAPLYRRQGDTPPLIFGRPTMLGGITAMTPRNDGSDVSEGGISDGGDVGEFPPGVEPEPTPIDGGGNYALAQALLYYISDDGQRHLDSSTDVVGENLAALGLDLDRATILDPTGTLPDSGAYFREAADGFVVIYLTASGRPCAHGSEACQLDGMSPANYFSQTSDDGLASWLSLPGPSGHPPSRIFHLPVTTAEGVSFERFADRCISEPNFPATTLDVMEPSDNAYFGPFVDGLRDAGGHGYNVDLCTALSSRADRAAITSAAYLERVLR